MKQQWQSMSAKFDAITGREQILILATGLIILFSLVFNFNIDKNLTDIDRNDGRKSQLQLSNNQLLTSNNLYRDALLEDPNKALLLQINEIERQLEKVDGELVSLTSDLINPIQMREALLQLLQMQGGVELVTMEKLNAIPLLTNEQLQSKKEADSTGEVEVVSQNTTAKEPQLQLYRHGIRMTLKGRYFDIRNYLQQVEKLPWQFFWHSFDYEVTSYPQAELTIELYSLSTKKEFIGV